jgi:hypothetical protein
VSRRDFCTMAAAYADRDRENTQEKEETGEINE